MHRFLLSLSITLVLVLLNPSVGHSQGSTTCDFLLPGISGGGTVSEVEIQQCTDDPCSVLIPQTDANGNVTYAQPAGCPDPGDVCDLLIPQTDANGNVTLVTPEGCGRLDPCSTVIPVVSDTGEVQQLRPSGCEPPPTNSNPTNPGGGDGTVTRRSGGGGRRGPFRPNWRLLENRSRTQPVQYERPVRRTIRQAKAAPAHSAADLPPTGPISSAIALTLLASASASLANIRYKRRK